jgi:hypothetical protein
LGKILIDVLVALFESLFGKLGNFASHHALLVSEEAITSSEEALEGYDLLEETELGVGLLLNLTLLLGFDGFFNS